MKKGRVILLFCIVFGLLLTACSQKGKMSKLEDEINSESGENGSNTNSNKEDAQKEDDENEKDKGNKDGTGTDGYQVEEIDTSETVGQFFYDPYRERMVCISIDWNGTDGTADLSEMKVTYMLKSLDDENKWVDDGKSWTMEGGDNLSFFNYSMEGDLYAISEENYNEKDYSVKNVLYKLVEGGKMEEVPLKNLNEAISTEYGDNYATMEGENGEEIKMPLFIVSMKVLNDGTIAVCYSNASIKFYDLSTGEEMRSLEIQAPIDRDRFIVAGDEIIAQSSMDLVSNYTLDVIDAYTGGVTRNIKFGDNFNDKIDGLLLCNGMENDFYLLAEGLAIYGGDVTCEEMDKIIDQSVLGNKPEWGYLSFSKGLEDDFYISYYEILNKEQSMETANGENVSEEIKMHLLHCYK